LPPSALRPVREPAASRAHRLAPTHGDASVHTGGRGRRAGLRQRAPYRTEAEGAESGCVLLPGIPHLGLDHRAGWVEAEADGTVTRLLSRVSIDLGEDPDIAVLATLCA
jgi:hypothetical protein